MSPASTRLQPSILFGEDFQLDLRPRRLRRGKHVLRLERIPFEILLLLVEHAGEVVTREQIVARIWGDGVFLDTDNSIRGAIRKIRHVLRDDPEQPTFINTITGKGYRFIAPVREAPPEEPPSSTPPTARLQKGEPAPALTFAGDPHRRIPALLRWSVPALAILALVACGYFIVKTRRTTSAAAGIRSLAVLPLKNLSSDPAQEYLADGMTEELIGRLAAIRDLRVISRTSVMRFKDTQLPLPSIAKMLGVDAVVEGSIIREGDRVRVHAQLIRAATDQHLWSESYDRELRSALTLESEVAEAIADKVEVSISGKERSRLTAARQVSPEVYENYLRGRFSLNTDTRSDLEQSIHYFQQAIEEDPTFAPAYVGLAQAYSALGTILAGAPPGEFRPRVIDAAKKALDLDPAQPQAHVLLADIYQKQWQWADCENEIRTALDLRPNDGPAHFAFSNLLLARGHIDDALDWARRGRQLDPDAVSGADIAWILFFARRYDEAERELRAELAVRPEEINGLWKLGFVLIAEGRADEAIAPLEQALTLSRGSPGVAGVLVRAYAGAGRRRDALRLLDQLKQRQRTGYVPAGAFIQASLGLGNNEVTFAWLNRAYAEKSTILQWVKVEPTFDPVRSDPRFSELIHRIGLD